MNKNILLIDGHSMINRAFYGVPPLTNSKGLHTNAIFGFFNIMLSVIDDIKPDYLMVAFDLKAPTFRHKMYEAYKGTRKPMPEELREQVPIVKEILKAMGITVMTQEGYEADDILGTMAKKAQEEGILVTILSGDRDLLQLATDKCRIRMPHTKSGKTVTEDFYEKEVLEKYQVSPAGIIELKALMGDASDNIPGVPKVGEKTATQLVSEYGTIENLKEHLEEITKKSIRETLQANFDKAELSKILATIDTSAPVAYTINDGTIKDIYTKEAYDLFKMAECKNILSRFEISNVKSKRTESSNFKYISELAEAEEFFALANTSKRAAVMMLGEKTSDRKYELCGAALAISEEKVVFIKSEGFLTGKYLLDKVRELYENKELELISFGIKKQLHFYHEEQLISPQYRERIYDVKVMAYLNNPISGNYSTEALLMEYEDISLPEQKEIFGKKTLVQAMEEMPQEFLEYACYTVYGCYKVFDSVSAELNEKGMTGLFNDIEMPLVFVLYDMEQEGIMVQADELKAYGEKLTDRIDELEKAIYLSAGCEFNINSPKQLGEVLFEKLSLPGGKKTKTGYSTAADVLEKMAGEHKIVADILEYRGLTKLKSTYAEGLFGYIDEDSRIRSTFHQTITATGRLSSADPNLQNIPVRTELGSRLRQVFVAKEGCVLIDADYSQIELRILACMSGDEKLIEAYGKEQDIHRICASQVFEVPLDEVTDTQRRNAKAVNFGIVYGISSFGLGQDLSISKKEAQQYIDRYFETYPGVKSFLDGLVAGAKSNGYVTTMFGRRRPVPEISSGNFMQKQFGERVAMNAPVQGTAADIMKIAMIGVANRIKAENLSAKLILQVHDELIIETPEAEKDQVMSLLKEEMENAVSLAVKLVAEVKSGKDWMEAH